MRKLAHSPPPAIGLAAGAQSFIPRRLSPEAGRALEILGHAIEYVADEYAANGGDKGSWGSADPRVEAIQLLKALNRMVYYSGGPAEPTLRRVRRWLWLRRAAGRPPGRAEGQ